MLRSAMVARTQYAKSVDYQMQSGVLVEDGHTSVVRKPSMDWASAGC